LKQHEEQQIRSFFEQKDENGVSNMEKAAKRSKVIRRIASTSKDKSFETSDAVKPLEGLPTGVVESDGRLVGLGIHIFNEDIYPLQSFEIYLRGCDLVGSLDLSGCDDMVFLDLYNNRISSVTLGSMKSMRILGLQNNRISRLDPRGLPACQGIDAGKNRLTELDVSQNPELVELYINDNDFRQIDISRNPKLKYFYCHNNGITALDTTCNPLLRHLNATNNPLREIRSLAPQQKERLPLSLTAADGGYVGLQFNPVYNAQWKETGEWQQSYYAYPGDGFLFDGWYDENGDRVFDGDVWVDAYGSSRVLTAAFRPVQKRPPDA
jgi:hypothetical protein